MTGHTWKREGRKSGPANVRDGRYEVTKGGNGRWFIRDRQLPMPDGSTRYLGNVYAGWRTMAEAKAWLAENRP